MQSMTGMGRAQAKIKDATVRVEIKSINHRFCEISVRLPARFFLLETLIRNLIKKSISRGKVDVFISEEKEAVLDTLEAQAFQSYYTYLKQIEKALEIPSTITMRDLIAGVGGWTQKAPDSDQLWQQIEPIIAQALQDLNEMRSKEGQNLKQDIQNRFVLIEKVVDDIHGRADQLRNEIEERLKKRIEEKSEELKSLDSQRLHQEILYYLDRLDVTEELSRLKSHLLQVEKFLLAEEAIGRKMDFLLQELNREFNTITSKSQNSEISYLVVDAKSELEKIREQIQNIE